MFLEHSFFDEDDLGRRIDCRDSVGYYTMPVETCNSRQILMNLVDRKRLFLCGLLLFVIFVVDVSAVDQASFLEELNGVSTQEEEPFLTKFINMLATLGLMLVLVLFAAWFIKRLNQTRLNQENETNVIKIIEKRVLSPKSMVHLLEVKGKEILVAESANGITKLAEFSLDECQKNKLI